MHPRSREAQYTYTVDRLDYFCKCPEPNAKASLDLLSGRCGLVVNKGGGTNDMRMALLVMPTPQSYSIK